MKGIKNCINKLVQYKLCELRGTLNHDNGMTILIQASKGEGATTREESRTLK
jgi:hypothetical protein